MVGGRLRVAGMLFGKIEKELRKNLRRFLRQLLPGNTMYKGLSLRKLLSKSVLRKPSVYETA